jgi:hypothetical protein
VRSFEIEMDRFRRIGRRDARNGTLVTADVENRPHRGGGDREMRFREPARDDLTFEPTV